MEELLQEHKFQIANENLNLVCQVLRDWDLADKIFDVEEDDFRTTLTISRVTEEDLSVIEDIIQQIED